MLTRRAIEHGFARFAQGILRIRWVVILSFVVLSVGLGNQLSLLRVDNSDESFLRRDDPARLAYDDFKDHFGKDSGLHVIFQPKEM